MRRLLTLCLTGTLLLTGCSGFNPHQLTVQPLHPTINPDHQLPESLKVDVSSRDMRSSALIGFRVGRFSDRAEVNLPLPANKALTDAARVALVKLGATPVSTDGDARLSVTLQDLEYTATQKALQTVELSASIQVTAEKYGQRFTGNYTTEKEHQFATTPTLEDNEKIVNELLLLTISRAFNDPKLISFLNTP